MAYIFFSAAHAVPGRQAALGPESLVTELYTTPGNIRDRVRESDDEAICKLKLAPGNSSSSARRGELLGAKWLVIVQGSEMGAE